MAKRKARSAPAQKRMGLRADRIRELRTAKGWNQPELAYRVGLFPAHISQLECGYRETRTDSLLKFCLVLETSADYLIGLTDDPKPRK